MLRDRVRKLRGGSLWLRAATRCTVGAVAAFGVAQVALPTASADPRCAIVPNPTETHHTECPGKDLTDIHWAHDDLEWANLAGANLTDAHLRGAHLDHANLSHANLTNALMQESTLTYTDFTFATMRSRPVDLTGPLLHMEGAKMFRANLDGANLDYPIWTGTDLTKATLRGAVVGSYFSQTTLTDADLTNAQVLSYTWRAAVLTGTIFCHTFVIDVGTVNSGCPPNRAVPRMEAAPILHGVGRIVITGQINRFGIRGVSVSCVNNTYVESADARGGRPIVGQPRLDLISSPKVVADSSSPLTISPGQGPLRRQPVTGIHLEFYPADNTSPKYPLAFKAIVYCTARRPDAWMLFSRT